MIRYDSGNDVTVLQHSPVDYRRPKCLDFVNDYERVRRSKLRNLGKFEAEKRKNSTFGRLRAHGTGLFVFRRGHIRAGHLPACGLNEAGTNCN
jgi:hypothetical protein